MGWGVVGNMGAVDVLIAVLLIMGNAIVGLSTGILAFTTGDALFVFTTGIALLAFTTGDALFVFTTGIALLAFTTGIALLAFTTGIALLAFTTGIALRAFTTGNPAPHTLGRSVDTTDGVNSKDGTSES